MQHLIKKQIIELGLTNKASAFNMQQLVSNHYHKDVLPLLEQVFDELSDEEETITIDHLGIDLGRLSVKDLQQNNWDQKILLKIKEQLYKKITRPSKDKNISQKTKLLNDCRQWLFYMETGCLPWNTLQTDKAWYRGVLEALAIDFEVITELRKLIAEKSDAIKRVVWQHDEIFLEKLIEILTAKSQRNLPKAISELQEVISHTYSLKNTSIHPEEIQQAIWGQILITAVEEGSISSWEDMIEKIIPFYLPDISLMKEVIANPSSRPKLILPLFKKLQKKPEVFGLKNESFLVEKYSIKNRGKGREKKAEINYATNLPEEGLFVRNAGTVLVHIFLPSLFNRLEYIKDKKFRNKVALQKALYLLHYIATGNIKAEEYALVIPKVLGTWPLKMPVEKEIKLTTEELNEADNLLLAVIEHWTVLKKTSIAGLREGFLQRNGKLFTKGQKLFLQVENKPIDVLLDHLPWNLSIIKLPWMKEILSVEWR